MAVRRLDLGADLRAALLDQTRVAVGLPPLRPDVVYGPDGCSPSSDTDPDAEQLMARYRIDPGAAHGFKSPEQAERFIAAGIANFHRWRFGGPRTDLCGARPRENGKRKHPCRRVRVKGQRRCPLHGGYSKAHRRQIHRDATLAAMGYRLRYAERKERERDILNDRAIADLFPPGRWTKLCTADQLLAAHILAKDQWTDDDRKNLDHLMCGL